MNKLINHVKTVMLHKKWVFHYADKAGIPIQGLFHDLSKFHPVELFESVKYYNGIKSPLEVSETLNGFSYAKLHHLHNNKHHYEYWQKNYIHGCEPILMPYKYNLEMICDYLAAAKTYLKNNFSYKKEYEWFLKKQYNNHLIKMHKVNKEFTKIVLEYMAKHNSDTILEDHIFLERIFSNLLLQQLCNK